MSVTVSLVPYFFISNLITGGYIALGASVMYGTFKTVDKAQVDTYQYGQNNEDIYHITQEEMEEIQEKEFQTNFVSRDTLFKTLTEHGAVIKKEMLGYIECVIENFTLKFYKEINDEKTPYTLKIEYSEDYNLDEMIEDINSEYVSNTQEASYNKVIKRLEEKNMNFEEDVYEDNTIVITVNLD